MAEPDLHTPKSPRLRDEELLRTEFRFRDPEDIDGLNRDVPDREAHPVIIGYYDETPPGGRKANPQAPMIRCCHCGFSRHWKGYVVRDDRGELYIIGARQCGRDHYGARFEAAEQAFKQEQARRTSLTRWRNMMKLVPALACEVEALLGSDALRRIELKRDEIKRASPEAFARLIRHHGSGDPMIAVREVRNFEAEAKREERYRQALWRYEAASPEERRELRDQGLRPERDTAPIFDRTNEAIGPLLGAGFLTNAGDVRAAAIALRDTLRSVANIERTGTDTVWVKDLNRALAEMADRPRRLRDALHEVALVSVFFERQNLERLERWSSALPRFTYLQDDGVLIVDDHSRGRTRIAPLKEIDLPPTPTISGVGYIDEDFVELTAAALR